MFHVEHCLDHIRIRCYISGMDTKDKEQWLEEYGRYVHDSATMTGGLGYFMMWESNYGSMAFTGWGDTRDAAINIIYGRMEAKVKEHRETRKG